jgi:hypothetical protein
MKAMQDSQAANLLKDRGGPVGPPPAVLPYTPTPYGMRLMLEQWL